MSRDGGHSDAVEVLHRRCQPDGLGHVGRAGLEALRGVGEGRSFHGDHGDHRAAGVERGHGLQDLWASPEAAHAGRTQHLVPGESHEVDVEGPHVHGHVRHRLAGVEHDQRPDLPGSGHEGSHIVDRAEDVRLVHERHHPRLLGDHAVQSLEVEVAVVGQADPAQDRTGLVAQLLPGHQVGVVLHLGHDDLVTRGEHEPLRTFRQGGAMLGLRGGRAERMADEVQRLGCVPGEDQLVGATTDEAGDHRPRRLERVRGLFGEEVRAAVHGGVVLLVELALRVEDRDRLLRGGCRVQVHQRPPAAHGARQDREVRPQSRVEQGAHAVATAGV